MIDLEGQSNYEIIAPYTAIKLAMLDAYHGVINSLSPYLHKKARGVSYSLVLGEFRDSLLTLFLLSRPYILTSSKKSDPLLIRFNNNIMELNSFSEVELINIFYRLQIILSNKKFINIETVINPLENMI